MSEAERQHVARMVDQNALPTGRASDHIAIAPSFERRQMLAFARAHHLCEFARRGGALQRFLFQRRQRHKLEEISLDAMAHEEAVIGGQRLLQMVAGIAAKSEIGAQYLVIAARRLWACRRHGQAEAIDLHN